MKLLTFCYEYPPLGGGGGVVFKQIVDVLAQRHAVTVITSGYGDLPAEEVIGNLRIIRVPVLLRRSLATATMPSMLSYWPASQRRGKRLLRDERFDLINSHFVVPSSPSADALARWFKIPHVLSIHGGDIFDPSKRSSPHRLPIVRGLVRRLLTRADRVVAQSNNTADNARRYYQLDRPVDVIPLGIVPAGRVAADRGKLEVAADRFVMVTVGRLVARKAVDDLLHVVAAMDDPKDLLVVVGDGPKREQWQSLAGQLGVAERVRFVGRVWEDEKQRWLAASDVFVSTSQHEGFGLVFLEAMDQGLPVVAYNHGGQTDFLVDGKTGGLVPLGRTQAFAESVRRLKTDQTLRKACGDHNRRHVQQFYIDRCAARYEALFEQVVAERRPAR